MTTILRAPASRHEGPAPVDLADAAQRHRLTPAAVRGVRTLVDVWALSVDEVCSLLGEVPASTWHSWRAKPPLDLGVDRLTRVSYLLGIYTALHGLHQGDLADQWVRRPNTNALFNGATPLRAMIDGGVPMMVEVRALLDGRRGGL